MIPNTYGIIHQNFPELSPLMNFPGDLIALPFQTLHDLSSASFEVIKPEWIEGSAITAANGTITAISGYHYSITDIDGFDYVLLPQYRIDDSHNPVSGLCTGAGTNINIRITIGAGGDYIHIPTCAYVLCKVDGSYHYAAVSCASDVFMPIIGIKVSA